MSSRHEIGNLLRPHWKRLVDELNPDIAPRLCSGCERILSRQEVEKIEAVTKQEGRTAGVKELLMLMARRSKDDVFLFAEILKETPGLEDLGKLVQQSFGEHIEAAPQESRERSDAAAEEMQLEPREQVMVLERKLSETKKRNCLMEAALRAKNHVTQSKVIRK